MLVWKCECVIGNKPLEQQCVTVCDNNAYHRVFKQCTTNFLVSNEIFRHVFTCMYVYSTLIK